LQLHVQAVHCSAVCFSYFILTLFFDFFSLSEFELEWPIEPKHMDEESRFFFEKTVQAMFHDECVEVGSCTTSFDDMIEADRHGFSSRIMSDDDDNNAVDNAANASNAKRPQILLVVRATNEEAEERASR
jgi:hypothetical protein